MSELKLTKRPAPPQEVIAAVTAAADHLTAVVVAAPEVASANAWRFSGRHFGPGHAVKYPRRVR